MATLLKKWLGYFRPMALGQFGRGRANGLALTCGQFWVRVRGGYNLYRWAGDRKWPQVDRIVGAVAADDDRVRPFSWVAHAASTRYWYLVRAVGGGGVEEVNTDRVVRVGFNGDGEMEGPIPNRPVDVWARPTTNGAVLLGWRYCSVDQQTWPASFAIYGDDGSGVVDWTTAVATVAMRRGSVMQMWTSESMAHRQRTVWGVRAVSAEGVLSDASATVAVWADAQGASVETAVSVEVGEDL